MGERASGKQIAAFRRPEINKVAESRYGRELPDNEEGRRFLRVMLEYAAHAPKSLTVAGVIDYWAPWLKDAERELFETEAGRSAPPRDSPEQIADRLGVSYAERQRLQLRTIGACDVSSEERRRLRKQQRAERARMKRVEEKQRVELMSECNVSAAAYPSKRLERQAALRTALASGEPVTVRALAQRVGRWAVFSGLSAKSRRRVINRELDALEQSELISSNCLPTGNPNITQRLVAAATSVTSDCPQQFHEDSVTNLICNEDSEDKPA